jgi:hypothetical protein
MKPGTRHKATRAALALLSGEVDKLTRKAVELALAGDVTALRFFAVTSLHLTKRIKRRLWNTPPGSGSPLDRAKFPLCPHRRATTHKLS